jgi:Ca2+-transporting ATPase
MPSQQQVTPQIQTNTHWHTLETTDTLSKLTVTEAQGLSGAEVETRRAQYGLNELVEQPLKSPFAILWEQIVNPLVLILLFAAAISALLGKTTEFIAIMAIVVLNAVLGVAQEYRAERAMAALKKMSAALVRVRRDGQVTDIEPSELVPGDIVLMEAGTIIPADTRLLESANLKIEEASLTGESVPVSKDTDVIGDETAPLGDRKNMAYMGTSVTYGRGVGVIVKTGMQTELGRIAQLIQSVESDKTPLQRRIDELGGVLIKIAVGVMILSMIVGLLTGMALDEVLLNGIAIAVAVVPEGLPAVITVALALGAQRMLRRRALIRKLPAVETLGSVTTICSDKTGTLTENKMTLTVVDVAGNRSSLEDVVGQGAATFIKMDQEARHSILGAQALTLAGGVLCTDATLEIVNNTYHTVGDPTETALAVGGARFGLIKNELDAAFPRVGEAPFDSERKRMTTIHEYTNGPSASEGAQHIAELLGMKQGEIIAFTKGAVDSLLTVATHIWLEGDVLALTPELYSRIEDGNNKLAEDGLRVLGLAYRMLDAVPEDLSPENLEQNLVIVGLTGIIDPPRQEVKDAVRVCKTAGIRPVMITGDHPLTAYAIAREIGITENGGRVLTGHDLAKMSQQDLENVVEEVSVYARVSPEHKLNIVQALQTKGEIVAMTGDGVNDAPALKRSNIGVAMGITGTAVSREAANMVILDDNFTTIVSAVEEGRTIYDNVRRFIKYLMASNSGELLVLLVTQLIPGMGIPLTTLQILWMNLITDGVPALALGVENPEKGVMDRAPYAPDESLFGRGLGRHIVIVGLLLGITGLGLGYWAWSNNVVAANGAPAWNTMVFVFLTIAQMGHVLGLRSHQESIFKMDFFSNKFLLGAVVVTIILQLGAVYVPFFNEIFETNPLTLEQITICLVLSTVVFWGVELEKLLIRRGVLS